MPTTQNEVTTFLSIQEEEVTLILAFRPSCTTFHLLLVCYYNHISLFFSLRVFLWRFALWWIVGLLLDFIPLDLDSLDLSTTSERLSMSANDWTSKNLNLDHDERLGMSDRHKHKKKPFPGSWTGPLLCFFISANLLIAMGEFVLLLIGSLSS